MEYALDSNYYLERFNSIIQKRNKEKREKIQIKINKLIEKNKKYGHDISEKYRWNSFWLNNTKFVDTFMNKDILSLIKFYSVPDITIDFHEDVYYISLIRKFDINMSSNQINHKNQLYWMLKAYSQVSRQNVKEFVRSIEIIQDVHINTYIWIYKNICNDNYLNVYSLNLNNMGIYSKKIKIYRKEGNFVRLLVLVNEYLLNYTSNLS